MGYSTTFYAIDLPRLQAAVGGSDAALRNRVIDAIRAETGEPENGPAPDLSIVVTLDGEILFNGRTWTADEFAAELRNPDWAGRVIQFHPRQPTNAEEEHRLSTGRFAEVGSFAMFLRAAMAASGVRYGGTCFRNREADLFEEDDEEITMERAVTELLAGTFTTEDSAHQYGYALEHVCAVLGTRLGTIAGKRRLKHLKLKTLLLQDRSPARLPDYDDFPYISFLGTDELQAEVEQLRSIDLAYPKDADTDADRRQFAAMLQSAVERQLAIVTFYY